MQKPVSVIGAPMWLGQTKYGTNLGPDAIRAAGLIARIRSYAGDVADTGNIKISTMAHYRTAEKNLKNLRPIATANEKLAARVDAVMEQKRFPLVLGGDHSIAIGTIAGAARHFNNMGVIWYDAHADINTPETTPSGNIHGMPLAASMGLGHPDLVGIGGKMNKIKPENIVMVGVRDIDPGEKLLIAQHNIRVYTVEDVGRLGMARVMQETVDYLAARCDGIHLSFDLDGIDPQEIPGVGTPVSGGISYRDSLEVVGLLAGSGLITSAEFVEVNPLLDRSAATVSAAIELIGSLLTQNGGQQNTSPACQPRRSQIV